MNELMIDKFVKYCEDNFNLNEKRYAELYNSLSVCIIDCVYSLRARYFKVVVPIVERYAKKYMDNNRFNSDDTLENLIYNIDSSGGPEIFAKEVLHNNQYSGGVLKTTICYEMARLLLMLGINTKEDFMNYKSTEILEIVIRSIKGVGDAATNYLFMLAGDPNRCKPDVHLHNCVNDACGYYISNDECQELMRDAVIKLNGKYPNLTVSLLDSIIWRVYQEKKINK